MTPLLSVRGAGFRYPGAARLALRDVALDIGAGEAVGIVANQAAARRPSAACWSARSCRARGPSRSRVGGGRISIARIPPGGGCR
jgi:ABC-type phosphonate transport system ATPase subunit